jgi:CDP-glucose 4,6-dehydratase
MDFWDSKKVLITGHTGFKGGWLSIWLQQLGATVTGLSLAPGTPSLFDKARVGEGMDSYLCDIRELKQLEHIMEICQPEIVIHMAAQSLVRASYADPVETFSTNIMGTVNLLETIRRIDSVRVFVNVTSDKCYENQGWVRGYRETDPMGGYDPYSCSKGCSELISSAYRRSFFDNGHMALATARAGNVIGGGDWAMDRLIPDIIRCILKDRPVAIRNPRATRPWQHVCEPLHGYLLLAERLWEKGSEYAESWNFGPDDGADRSVSWIAEYLCSQHGKNASWYHAGGAPLHETLHLKIDCSKAKERLNWKPMLDLKTALDWTLEWYHACENDGNMRAITEKQLLRYQEMCNGA